MLPLIKSWINFCICFGLEVLLYYYVLLFNIYGVALFTTFEFATCVFYLFFNKLKFLLLIKIKRKKRTKLERKFQIKWSRGVLSTSPAACIAFLKIFFFFFFIFSFYLAKFRKELQNKVNSCIGWYEIGCCMHLKVLRQP